MRESKISTMRGAVAPSHKRGRWEVQGASRGRDPGRARRGPARLFWRGRAYDTVDEALTDLEWALRTVQRSNENEGRGGDEPRKS